MSQILKLLVCLCFLSSLVAVAATVAVAESPDTGPGSNRSAADAADASFQLTSNCPPSFKKTEAGVCELRSLYQFYDSLQNKGLGGTQTALPEHRDGFTPEQIDLGRYLFFDPALSGDGTVSCASCHQPALGFSDGRGRSVGIGGHTVTRAAPSLWNVAFQKRLFWDARADSLEEQAQGPLYAEDEMGNSPQQLLATLSSNPIYFALFRQAYPLGELDEISLGQVYRALAAFQSSLISLNSRYDRYAHGYHAALTDKEIEGMNVFRSFVARCAECHTPPLFTNQQIAVIGAPEPAGLPMDVGAEAILNEPRLKAGFKVPSLRNVARTAPYMHSGGFETLRETVSFYNEGRGHAVPEGVDLHLHWHIWEPNLTDYEIDRVVDFLHTLTDESLTPQIPRRVPSGLTPTNHPPGSTNITSNTTAPTTSITSTNRKTSS